MIPIAFALAAALAAGASASALPQTGASRLVLATATDPRNRPLVDVGPDDFVVQEGADAREILSVRVADYPIVVLVDTGVEARADFPLAQKAVMHFIERLGAERPLAVATFGDVPKLIAAFDEGRRIVMERVGSLIANSTSGSELLRGAALAADALRATQSLFSAIVVVSATPVDVSRSEPEELMGSIVDSGAIVHVVAHRANRDVMSGTVSNPRAQTLRAVVEQSRGELTTIYSAASYQAALDRLADRLSSELLIEYLVPPGSKPADVKVGIRVAGARVRGLGVAPR